MADYGRVFGEEVALGLGLGSPPILSPETAVKEYRENPADAFSRVAELMQPPGGAIPIPFATTVINIKPARRAS